MFPKTAVKREEGTTKSREQDDGKIRMTNVSDESYMVDTYMYHLQSRNRVASTDSSTNFTISFPFPLSCDPLKEYFLVSLNSAEIPYSFYGINATNNHFQIIYEASVAPHDPITADIYITPGNYNIHQFCHEFEQALDTTIPNDAYHTRTAGLPIISGTYDNTQGRIWVQNNSPAPESRTYTFVIFDPSINHFTYPTGFIPGTHPYPFGHGQFGSRCVNMGYTHNLYVRTNLENTNTYGSDVRGTTNILCKIPIQVLPFEINQFNNYYNASGVKIRNHSISSVSVRLTDLFGVDVDLNQMDWEFTLKFKKFRYRNRVIEGDRFQPPPEEQEEEGEEERDIEMGGGGIQRTEEEMESAPLPYTKGGWIPTQRAQWDPVPSTPAEERDLMPVLLDSLPLELRMEYLLSGSETTP